MSTNNEVKLWVSNPRKLMISRFYVVMQTNLSRVARLAFSITNLTFLSFYEIDQILEFLSGSFFNIGIHISNKKVA